MMKKTSLIFTVSLFLCSIFCFQAQAQSHHKKTQLKQVNQNKKVKKKINYRYTGPINKEELTNSKYTKRWFDPRYDRYTPNKEALSQIKKHINDYKIIYFMGTWCPDSHREIPKLYKILDKVGYNMNNLKAYTLNHGMSSKEHHEKGYDIQRVPTIIFYKNGKEVNRFVEHARESLAKDIAKIVSGQPYKNHIQK